MIQPSAEDFEVLNPSVKPEFTVEDVAARMREIFKDKVANPNLFPKIFDYQVKIAMFELTHFTSGKNVVSENSKNCEDLNS